MPSRGRSRPPRSGARGPRADAPRRGRGRRRGAAVRPRRRRGAAPGANHPPLPRALGVCRSAKPTRRTTLRRLFLRQDRAGVRGAGRALQVPPTGPLQAQWRDAEPCICRKGRLHGRVACTRRSDEPPTDVDRDAATAAPSSRDSRRTPAAPRTGRRCRRPGLKRREEVKRRGPGRAEQARACRRHHDGASARVSSRPSPACARMSTPRARSATTALALIDSSRRPRGDAAAPRAHGKLPRRREVAQQHLGHRRAARVARADEHDGERARGLLLVTGRRGHAARGHDDG